VAPLSLRGIQLCTALERADGHWRSRSACRCGFIRMAGSFASPEPFVPLGPQPGLHVQADDGRSLDAEALYAALTGPVADVPAGVRVAGLGELSDAGRGLSTQIMETPPSGVAERRLAFAASHLRSPVSCSSGAGPTISGSGRPTTDSSLSAYGTRDRT
jgi:hypothetical protein